MSDVKERANRVASDDFAALLQLADDVRWDLDSLPNQIAAAEALKRSIQSLVREHSDMKFEVVKVRYAKLMATL
jgi:hypothetical protein